jgi:hypothetical protein
LHDSLQPVLAIIAGISILLVPRLPNPVAAMFLIGFGVPGLMRE